MLEAKRSGASDEELARISDGAQELVLEPGEILFRNEQRGDSAYVVLTGRLLLACSKHEFEHPAAVALPGDVLCDREFLTGAAHRCSAYATERSTVLKILYDLVPEKTRCWDEPDSLDLRPDGGAERTLRSIERRACEILRADRARVFVRDPETGDLTVKQGSEEIRVPAGTEIVGWVAQTLEIVNLTDARLDPRFDAEEDARRGYRTRTLLAAPVLDSNGRVLAVIEVLNKRTGLFTPDDEVLLHALTHQCGAALQSLFA